MCAVIYWIAHVGKLREIAEEQEAAARREREQQQELLRQQREARAALEAEKVEREEALAAARARVSYLEAQVRMVGVGPRGTRPGALPGGAV